MKKATEQKNARRLVLRAERVLTDGRWVHPRAPHGTRSAYCNYSCRCEPCSVVYLAAMVKYRADRPFVIQDGRRFVLDANHGTQSGYGIGCRCQPCTSAASTARTLLRVKSRTEKKAEAR